MGGLCSRASSVGTGPPRPRGAAGARAGRPGDDGRQIFGYLNPEDPDIFAIAGAQQTSEVVDHHGQDYAYEDNAAEFDDEYDEDHASTAGDITSSGRRWRLGN